MSELKNQEINDLSTYIKKLTDQDCKVLLLKLKNELNKEDVSWEQVRNILNIIYKKDEKVLLDVIPFILV